MCLHQADPLKESNRWKREGERERGKNGWIHSGQRYAKQYLGAGGGIWKLRRQGDGGREITNQPLHKVAFERLNWCVRRGPDRNKQLLSSRGSVWHGGAGRQTGRQTPTSPQPEGTRRKRNRLSTRIQWLRRRHMQQTFVLKFDLHKRCRLVIRPAILLSTVRGLLFRISRGNTTNSILSPMATRRGLTLGIVTSAFRAGRSEFGLVISYCRGLWKERFRILRVSCNC